jgi:diguanylate cyclase (GGDEF)-like protein
VLVVDDDADYLAATKNLLAAEGHRVITAIGGRAALTTLRTEPVDLVLLDFFMPEMTGEQVVAELRVFNPLTQVILQTGYSSQKPAREMMRRLDIQGYCDKAEGPEKLLLWTEVGLKAAYTVQMLEKNRRGLRYILDVTPDLHRLQPLDDLLQGILWQVAGLLGAADTFVAEVTAASGAPLSGGPEGLLAMLDDGTLRVHAATGRFSAGRRLEDDLQAEMLAQVKGALTDGSARTAGSSSIVPLRVGQRTLGVLYLDRPPVVDRDSELLSLFANQAAVAIHNAQLHEMATLDSLTGVAVRRFFEQCFTLEVRNAYREESPLALLLLDLDGMKQINDRGGHLAGDRALALVGQVLRETLRGADVAGRFGGDEFAVVLPRTTAPQAADAAQRVMAAMRGASVEGTAGPIAVACSIGVAAFEPQPIDWEKVPRPLAGQFFQDAATTLLDAADANLYKAKGRKDGTVGPLTSMPWPDPTAEPEAAREVA